MNQSIILLTYKGKVLLMHKDLVLASAEENPWHFITGVTWKNESSQKTIQREVERETTIQLRGFTFLGSLMEGTRKNYCYYTQLTDNNVDNIMPREGYVLGFFSAKELNSIVLSSTTKLLLEGYGDTLLDKQNV